MNESYITNTTLISPEMKVYFYTFLRSRYGRGPLIFNTKIYSAREMVEKIVSELNRMLKHEKSKIQVSIEADHSRYYYPKTCGGDGLVKSLIIHDDSQTILRDLTISPTLVRLADKPIYIDHVDGAVELLDAIIAEVEQCVTKVEAN